MRVVTETEHRPWRNDEKSELNDADPSSVYGGNERSEVMVTQRVLEREYGRRIKIPVLNRSRSLGDRGSDT